MGALILIAALLATGSPQFQVDTLDGQTAAGTLVELNAQQVTVRGIRGDQSFKSSEVRLVEAQEPPGSLAASSSAAGTGVGTLPKPAEATVVVETLDGARMSGSEYEAAKGIGKLKLASGETILVPTKFVHRVEFLPDGKSPVWPELPKDAAGDLIIVQKKDAVDLAEGVAGDVTPDTVNFSIDSGVVPVKRSRVLGLVYFHPQVDSMPQSAAIVESKAGSKLNAKEVALADGNLKVTTTFGATVDWPLESIRAIDFSPSRMVYLSDLAPDSSDWTPLLDFGKQSDAVSQFYKPRFDRSLDGGKLSIGGKPYRKGVAMSARTVLEYRIAGRGRQFRATAGIDDAVHGAGSVQLTVEGDGKTLYSGKITGRGAPVDLNLDVSDVKRLRITADFGGGADVGDYLDLGDARIVK